MNNSSHPVSANTLKTNTLENENEEVDLITRKLMEIWEAADRKIEESVDRTQNEIVRLMERMIDEKMKKILEINAKYEMELKDLEAEIDPSKIKIFFTFFDK